MPGSNPRSFALRSPPLLASLCLILLAGAPSLEVDAHHSTSGATRLGPSSEALESFMPFGNEPAPPQASGRDSAISSLSAPSDPAARARIQRDYGRLPMYFEPNLGQTADEVHFLARGAGYSLFLTDTEAVLVLRKGNTLPPPDADLGARAPADAVSSSSPDSRSKTGSRLLRQPVPEADAGASPLVPTPEGVSQTACMHLSAKSTPPGGERWGEGGNPDSQPLPPTSRTQAQACAHRHAGSSRHARLTPREPMPPPQTAVVRMRLEGPNRNATPEVTGLERRPGVSNYYLGDDPAKWRSGVPRYGRVRYDAVYPGIDLVFYGNPQELEYDFVVAPGADPSQIRLSFQGADGIRIDEAGNLVLAVDDGEILQPPPRVYQRIGGEERLVEASYRLIEDAGWVSVPAGAPPSQETPVTQRLAFTLADYDPQEPLIIDPVVLYSTYLGGSYSDWAAGIAVDGAGNAYVVGSTTSSDFPTVNARYPKLWGSGDAFVTKLDAAGQGPLYSTYLGGSEWEEAAGIAVDSAGNAYVVGSTTSSDFPTVNARYPKLWGGGDAFVTKLDAAGQGPLYSTYLGGSEWEGAAGIAVDGAGNAYVVGSTQSSDFPAVNARYPKLWGSGDAFVTKLDAAGQGPLYSTYLGGSEWEEAAGIAVDSAGNAYVVPDRKACFILQDNGLKYGPMVEVLVPRPINRDAMAAKALISRCRDGHRKWFSNENRMNLHELRHCNPHARNHQAPIATR